MQLHVHHQGNQIGPFTTEAVAEMVRLGTLGPDASVWHEGLPDWVPVNEFLQQLPAPAAPAAIATSAAAANESSRWWLMNFGKGKPRALPKPDPMLATTPAQQVCELDVASTRLGLP